MKNRILARHTDGRVIPFSELNWKLLGPNKDGWTPVETDVPEEVKQDIQTRLENQNQPPNKVRRKDKPDA